MTPHAGFGSCEIPARVVDASVLASMFFLEPRAEEARSAVTGVELHAPTLLPYELANVARSKILQRPDMRETLLQALQVAISLRITWEEVDHAAVLQLALETGLSAYDASYLYLARALGADLVTFDQRLGAVGEGRLL